MIRSPKANTITIHYSLFTIHYSLFQGVSPMKKEAPSVDLWLREAKASPEAADALCSAVKPGYTGDSLKLTQIAAVSVHVMDKGREAKRRLWVDALERAKKAAPTRDVETFFVQQLMVCGYEQMKTIR